MTLKDLADMRKSYHAYDVSTSLTTSERAVTVKEIKEDIIKTCRELLERKIIISARQCGKTSRMYMQAGAVKALMEWAGLTEKDLEEKG